MTPPPTHTCQPTTFLGGCTSSFLGVRSGSAAHTTDRAVADWNGNLPGFAHGLYRACAPARLAGQPDMTYDIGSNACLYVGRYALMHILTYALMYACLIAGLTRHVIHAAYWLALSGLLTRICSLSRTLTHTLALNRGWEMAKDHTLSISSCIFYLSLCIYLSI